MRVAIAEDSGIFRQALVTLLQTVGVAVTQACATGQELLAFLEGQARDTDAVILDLHMPPTFSNEGSKAALEIKSRYPRLGVLILSAFNETPQAVSLFQRSNGGIGYLLKDNVTDVTTLRESLHRIVSGEAVIDPLVVRKLVSAQHRSSELATLSAREREVLSLMAQGYSNAGIARRLFLSTRTAEDHVREIFLKLDIGSMNSEPGQVDANKRVLAVLTWLRAVQVCP